MKYYNIEYSINQQEVGSTFPQSQKAHHHINVDDPRHLWSQGLHKLPENIVIPDPILHHRAKLSDLISTATISWQLIVSNKLKQLLEKYLISEEGEFHPVTVWKRDQQFNYWLYNPILFKQEFINYQKSVLWLEDIGGGKIKPLNMQSFTDFKNITSGLSTSERFGIHELHINVDIPQDFFQLRHVPTGIAYCISENVKAEIEMAGCTGIEFQEIPS